MDQIWAENIKNEHISTDTNIVADISCVPTSSSMHIGAKPNAVHSQFDFVSNNRPQQQLSIWSSARVDLQLQLSIYGRWRACILHCVFDLGSDLLLIYISALMYCNKSRD